MSIILSEDILNSKYVPIQNINHYFIYQLPRQYFNSYIKLTLFITFLAVKYGDLSVK